jgi:hypothetical protein
LISSIAVKLTNVPEEKIDGFCRTMGFDTLDARDMQLIISMRLAGGSERP